MNITFRKATPEDATSIARMQVQAWQETYASIFPKPLLDALKVETRTTSWVTNLERPDHCTVHLALIDGEICGIAGGGKTRETEATAARYQGEVYFLHVLQSAKGKGLERLLMSKVAQDLKQEGLKGAMLWVLEKVSSNGFYEQLGAKEVSRRTITAADHRMAQIMYAWEDFDP